MTIKKLCKHIAPNIKLKIRNTNGLIDEIIAGDVSKQSKAFQDIVVKDWTVYPNHPDNLCSETFVIVDID